MNPFTEGGSPPLAAAAAAPLLSVQILYLYKYIFIALLTSSSCAVVLALPFLAARARLCRSTCHSKTKKLRFQVVGIPFTGLRLGIASRSDSDS